MKKAVRRGTHMSGTVSCDLLVTGRKEIDRLFIRRKRWLLSSSDSGIDLSAYGWAINSTSSNSCDYTKATARKM